MRTTDLRLAQRTIAIAALALATIVATPSFGRDNGALTIRAVAVHGRVVTITAANTTPGASRGTIVVRMLTKRGPLERTLAVAVAGGQTRTIRMEVPDTVSGVLPVGVVVDDGVPF